LFKTAASQIWRPPGNRLYGRARRRLLAGRAL